MTEAELLKTVTDMADLFGWRWTHFRPGLTQSGAWRTPLQGSKGFPDLVMIRNGRLIFAELKSQKGPTPPSQQKWLMDLNRSEAEVYLWRPSDLDEIERVLR